MIRSSGKHNARAAPFLHFGKLTSALLFDIRFCAMLLVPCARYCPFYLARRDPPFFFAQSAKSVRGYFLVCKRHERSYVFHSSVRNGFNIVFKIFRIRHNNRTVIMVLGIFRLAVFIEHARVKYCFHPVLNEPFNMPVGKLCRVTLGFGWNRFHSEFVYFPCGIRRQHNGKSEFFEKCCPERIVFVHV